MAPRSTELFGAARIEGFPSRQFESVDAAFINGSVAQSDAHFGTAYAWQIVRRASEKSVGKITLPVSSAPFHVNDALIYVRLPASAAPDANGELQAGLNRVEAFDLSKQRSLYVIELMEPNYLGVMPP